MHRMGSFFDAQLEEIQKYYLQLRREQQDVTMKEAVLAWFVSGKAEEFRQKYLKRQAVAVH